MNYKAGSSLVRIMPPYPLTRTLSVKPGDAGRELLGYLCERFPYIPLNEWLSRMEKKWIWFDDGPATPQSSLKQNQIIYHHSPAVKEPAVPDDVRIIREDDDWLIAYKPAPMPMHQGGRYYKNTLSYILAEMGFKNLHVVHRLDAVTSGLVLLAKNREMAGRLQTLFSENQVKKWYLARVAGNPGVKTMVVDAPIRRKRGFVFECGTSLAGAKPAQTIIEPLPSRGGRHFVACYPITGRTHQIRLHLREAGVPIPDDPIYGPGGDTSGKRLQNRAISLQSSGIKINQFSIHEEIEAPGHWFGAEYHCEN